jgi:hypothetical protein
MAQLIGSGGGGFVAIQAHPSTGQPLKSRVIQTVLVIPAAMRVRFSVGTALCLGSPDSEFSTGSNRARPVGMASHVTGREYQLLDCQQDSRN